MCRTEFRNVLNSLLSNVQASGMFMQLAHVIKKIYNFNKDPSKQTLDWHMFASHAVVLADTTSSAAYYSSSHGWHYSRGPSMHLCIPQRWDILPVVLRVSVSSPIYALVYPTVMEHSSCCVMYLHYKYFRVLCAECKMAESVTYSNK
jgi:hypothetical protein